ncbi:GntR family transcriptional regulator YhfZ [Entomospira culicis]|uniref:HTH gntR-type domain-containing protein n=1 Tax=Entomospira culicis TaxID=2719989 RepID=A0A968KW26_9SPIO|nr:GntR family transcriptional regulator YhfZ [Entomospira culicis]NIZ19322.1 hypothetical protein [Entomospira culicis]NIZ69773.1 hypothetical protein [Entomospira culicis]WDI36884.1 GntR family transcriptional regulator YhfZ [Entomospira culicis]WDI38513.1 GntR family transcriptional regulator YhfZ [Entomospira culicis]
MMHEEFLQKTGKVIELLASEILLLHVGDRLPVISDWVERYNLSRGTVQNAIQVLRQKEAIVTKSRGHLGTFLIDIDYQKLQHFALRGPLRGSMPLPYSKLYEGLASGLYDTFMQVDLSLSLAYVRGAKDRIHQVLEGLYHFSIVSGLAADFAIKSGAPLEILFNFGSKTYLSGHVILFAHPHKALQAGMRVAIDMSSYDQSYLTQALVRDLDVELIPMGAHQIINNLLHNKIDAGVWNYDQVLMHQYPLAYQFIDNPLTDRATQAVLVGFQRNFVINTILKRTINQEHVLAVQHEVVYDLRVPKY